MTGLKAVVIQKDENGIPEMIVVNSDFKSRKAFKKAMEDKGMKVLRIQIDEDEE